MWILLILCLIAASCTFKLKIIIRIENDDRCHFYIIDHLLYYASL